MPPYSQPMWYCHQCETEMQPLMAPDPHCTSCNGTFVEMVEDTRDDPRAWRGEGPGGDEGFYDFASRLRPTPIPGGGGFAFSINRSSSSGGGTRTLVFERPGQPDTRSDGVMPLRDFLAETAGDRGGGTMGPHNQIMINHIIGTLLNQISNQQTPGAPHPLPDIFQMPRGTLEGGRFGDYVLDQAALDQVMTALMETSGAHRPVAATEEVLEKLNREVLEEGSPHLESDCSVCKDQFSLETEDPDEQVVITLPCKHPFHSPCILPWLKQNGTCPTCRYQLVPQPGSTENANNNSGSGPSTSSTNPPQATSRIPEPTERNSGAGGGFFNTVGNFFHSWAGHQNTGPLPSSSRSELDSLPGGWEPRPSSFSEQRRHQTTQSGDRRGSLHGSTSASSDLRDRRGEEESSYHRRSSYDRRAGRRRGTRRRGSGEPPELD